MSIRNNIIVRASSNLLLSTLLFLFAFSASARGVYQSDEDFLAEIFNGNIPESQVVWMRGDIPVAVADILGHDYAGLRVRYWQNEQRSAWILEEIGKTQLITYGVVIAEHKIENVKVLAFRESRGDEIRFPAFTSQFQGAEYSKGQLDRTIDGISGATLSVRSMTSVVKMALYLDKSISTKQ
jgi:hypothetical protein